MDYKTKILNYIEQWEHQGYPNGIPDEVEHKLEQSGKVPTYKRICKAILKNDITLESLGYTRPRCDIYDTLKKQELIERGNVIVQLKLF